MPGRKLHEICRAIPDGTTVDVGLNGERLTVKAGRSRFQSRPPDDCNVR